MASPPSAISVGLAAPYWLKLQRTGNVFTPYHSLDGITWTQTAAPVTLSLPTTCYVGFAATAHNNTRLTAAQFDHISLATNAPVANGTYRVISRLSGKALDAMGTGDGTQIIQWPYSGGAMQQWTVTHTGNGQYSIIGIQSGKALDIEFGGTNDGAKVQLYSNWGGPMQKFTFTPADSGYFRITPVSSPNSCLDVTGVATADGATIQQSTYRGGSGQQWSIQNP